MISLSLYHSLFSIELYHGRLDKLPGAIAYRLRWYGAGDPKMVFFERKTHRDTWTGEASVKERFIVSILYTLVIAESIVFFYDTQKSIIPIVIIII